MANVSTRSAFSAEEGAQRLARLLTKHAPRVVVLTGAGASTDSGIPDYRGPQGTYVRSPNYRPIFYQEFVNSHVARQRYWARSYLGYGPIHQARPSSTHVVLAQLQAQGLVQRIITQNVDGLHQAAGSPHVLELHGSLATVRCLSCGHTIPRARFQKLLAILNRPWSQFLNQLMRPSGSRPAPVLKLNPDGDVELPSDSGLHYSSLVYPFCEHCIHGIYKPSVVFFGENIAPEFKDTVADWIRQAEATLVIGSSLTTYSAFRLVQLAHSLQHSICILNRGATQGDGLATLRLDNSCGEIMSLVSTIVANSNMPEDRL